MDPSPTGEWVKWSDLAALFSAEDVLFLRHVAGETRGLQANRAAHLEAIAAKIEALVGP